MAKVEGTRALFAALKAAGLADDNTRRVVIDIGHTGQPPVIYTERYGDESLIEIVRAVGAEIRDAKPQPLRGAPPDTITVPTGRVRDVGPPVEDRRDCICDRLEVTSFGEVDKGLRSCIRGERTPGCIWHDGPPAPGEGLNPKSSCGRVSKPSSQYGVIRCILYPNHTGLHAAMFGAPGGAVGWDDEGNFIDVPPLGAKWSDEHSSSNSEGRITDDKA